MREGFILCFFVMTCVTCVKFVGSLTAVVGVFLKFNLVGVDIVGNPRITSSSLFVPAGTGRPMRDSV